MISPLLSLSQTYISFRLLQPMTCTTNHWHYENKQGTIKKPYKNATRNAKFFLKFFKHCWLLGPFSKKPCFWKMGMAGIKWWPCLSTRPSFSVKALKTNEFWNSFLHFYLHFQQTFHWYIVCFHTPNGFSYNLTLLPSHLNWPPLCNMFEFAVIL